jgi:hypothetical protein
MNSTARSNVHDRKDVEQRISTPFGMQIDVKDEQYAKAPDSIRRSCDSDANVTSLREWHDAKQFARRIRTHFGTIIADNDEQSRKASASIRWTFEGCPNETVDIALQPEKDLQQRTSR